MATALSGELSRRRLGTQSGDMRRESRRLKRDGYEAAAGRMALGASEQRLNEGGAVSSSEATIAERDESMARDRGLMRLKRDAVLKPEAGVTSPAGGATKSVAMGASEPSRPTTNASLNAARPGETASQVLERQRTSRAGASASTGQPASSVTTPDAKEEFFTEDPFAFAAKEAAEPARRLAMRDAEDKLTQSTGFGKEYATPNIEKLGLSGAIADYRRREAEGAKPLSSASTAEGPLTRAMNGALARNAERATDAVAADKITAGINAAPTPKLDTSFPTPAPASAAPTVPVAPTALSRPAAPRSGAFNLGAKIHDTIAGSLKSPDYSKPVLDSQGNPYTTRGFTPKLQLAGKLTAPELTPEAKRAAELAKKKTKPVGDFTSGLVRGSR